MYENEAGDLKELVAAREHLGKLIDKLIKDVKSK